MKSILTLLFLITFIILNAQKIEYSIPEGYETGITKKDYKYLVDEAIKSISKHYKIASVKDGVVELQKGQDFAIINLHNLILKCADTPRENWLELIQAHFDSMYASMEKQKQLDPNKFETLVDYFSIRIYQKSFIDQNGGADNLIVREDLGGTLSVLMLDLPSAFTPVRKETFDLWNKTPDEVFAIAQRNVNKQSFTKESHAIDVGGNKIDVHFIENEDYGASLALDLINNAPEFVGEWGSVIAIPNRGIVNICKVTKERPMDFVLFIRKFKPVVEKFYNQHPQPISTDFYWYFNGQFTRINVTENNNGDTQVISPKGLTERMNKKE